MENKGEIIIYQNKENDISDVEQAYLKTIKDVEKKIGGKEK